MIKNYHLYTTKGTKPAPASGFLYFIISHKCANIVSTLLLPYVINISTTTHLTYTYKIALFVDANFNYQYYLYLHKINCDPNKFHTWNTNNMYNIIYY